jgi:hypothetical protein
VTPSPHRPTSGLAMLNRHFYSDPIDRPELREGHVELSPVQHVASPRFVFRIEGSMWIYTDTVTGEERSFHGAELGRAWSWKDAIVARERAEQKQEAA